MIHQGIMSDHPVIIPVTTIHIYSILKQEAYNMTTEYTKRQIKTYINRYEHLKQVMLKLSAHEAEKHIFMDEWELTGICGTTYCVAGWAGSTPWFRHQGFKLLKRTVNGQDDLRDLPSSYLYPSYKHYVGWSAIEQFFGGNSRDTSVVFNGGTHPVFGNSAYDTYQPTALQVVERIEAEIQWLKGLKPA